MSEMSERSSRIVPTVLAVVVTALLAGCGTAPAGPGSAPPPVTGSNEGACDSNRDYAMTGVVHAMTQRERDDCRRASGRPMTP